MPDPSINPGPGLFFLRAHMKDGTLVTSESRVHNHFWTQNLVVLRDSLLYGYEVPKALAQAKELGYTDVEVYPLTVVECLSEAEVEILKSGKLNGTQKPPTIGELELLA